MKASGTSSDRAAWATLLRGLDVQCRVVGALIMRELHTRYGRDNIGYLWLFGEPMLLATAVALLHLAHASSLPGTFQAVPFTITGYVGYMVFRNIVNRAESAIEGNASLMFHRMVTLYDILLARALLETLSMILAFTALITLQAVLGFGTLPARPGVILLGYFFMFWFCFGLSMIACAATHDNSFAPKIIHPTTYILLPLSGAFYAAGWLSPHFAAIATWLPLVGIFELLRYGQFAAATLRYVDFSYLVITCLAVNVIGHLAITVTRRHIHLG